MENSHNIANICFEPWEEVVGVDIEKKVAFYQIAPLVSMPSLSTLTMS